MNPLAPGERWMCVKGEFAGRVVRVLNHESAGFGPIVRVAYVTDNDRYSWLESVHTFTGWYRHLRPEGRFETLEVLMVRDLIEQNRWARQKELMRNCPVMAYLRGGIRDRLGVKR